MREEDSDLEENPVDEQDDAEEEGDEGRETFAVDTAPAEAIKDQVE